MIRCIVCENKFDPDELDEDGWCRTCIAAHWETVDYRAWVLRGG